MDSKGSEIMEHSPRLNALGQQLEAGNAAAVDEFWQEVAAHGAPLVEGSERNPDHVLVTFLWRAVENIRAVAVICDDLLFTDLGGGSGLAENAMTRFQDTDIWFKTYRLLADYHLNYLLSPNDPQLLGESPEPWGEKWQEMNASWQLDPLNHRKLATIDNDVPHPEREAWLAGSTWMKPFNSYVRLPGADPQPWYAERPGVPAGKVEKHAFTSSVLGNTRAVYVYTPPGYSTPQPPYGRLILFDAWIYHSIIPTPVILDNLLAEGLIPPLIAVIIDQPDLHDREEMTRNPPFLDFLTKELLPWVSEQYDVSTDPAETIVGGSSRGGLAACLAALEHPEHFGNVLAQACACRDRAPLARGKEGLAKAFETRGRLPLRFYLDVGVHDELLKPVRALREVLDKKSYPVNYREYYGGHNILCWRETLAVGIQALAN